MCQPEACTCSDGSIEQFSNGTALAAKVPTCGMDRVFLERFREWGRELLVASEEEQGSC